MMMVVEFVASPYPSFFQRIIITALIFKAKTYNWVMLLIVLYDGVMFVRMTW